MFGVSRTNGRASCRHPGSVVRRPEEKGQRHDEDYGDDDDEEEEEAATAEEEEEEEVESIVPRPSLRTPRTTRFSSHHISYRCTMRYQCSLFLFLSLYLPLSAP